MIEELRDITFYITIKDVIGRLVVSFLCGVIISILYRVTYKGGNYPVKFANSIIFLTLITSVVIMVIGNNLAAAFGLAGAMSIIRFRTAVKDVQDIMFIFFSLAIGLACGVDLISVAIFSTLIIGAVFYFIVLFNVNRPKKKNFQLQLIFTGNESNNEHVEYVMDKFCTGCKVINIKSEVNESQQALQVLYYVKFKKEVNSEKFINEIKSINGISHANLSFEGKRQNE